MKSEDGQIYDYLFHSERTKYTLGDASELTRLQLLFIVQCQAVYAEKVADIEKRSKYANNPLTIFDTDDSDTLVDKLARIDEIIKPELEYEQH